MPVGLPVGVVFLDDMSTVSVDCLGGGFFEGWPAPPDAATHLAHLRGAEVAVVALDPATGNVVGFVTAIGDGVLTAFVPLLEVLPAWRGRGIGTALMERVLGRLAGRYAVDLSCDPELVPYYERLGGTRGTAVMWRRRSVDRP
jgi:GNAT superfamily N-acetyltransferase